MRASQAFLVRVGVSGAEGTAAAHLNLGHQEALPGLGGRNRDRVATDISVSAAAGSRCAIQGPGGPLRLFEGGLDPGDPFRVRGATAEAAGAVGV